MPDKHISTVADLQAQYGDDPAAWPSAVGSFMLRAADEHRAQGQWVLARAMRGQERAVTASEKKAAEAHAEHAEELERVAPLVGQREQNAADAYAEVGHTGRRSGGALAGVDETYRRNSGHSYFRDLVAQQLQPTPACAQRLARHAEQMDQALASGEVEKRSRLYATPADLDGLEVRTNPSRIDGQGGYFTPPLWLIEEYVNYARPGRAIADLLRPIPLPPGTDSINLPKILTSTATGVQTADAAAVTSQDMTDTFLTAPVRTIAGQQDFAMQLLDQSPINFDEVIYRDLMADYNQKLDLQALSGTGLNGQCLGILNVTGINAVTFTNASPTLPLLWLPIMQAASKVANGVFTPPTAIAMSASQWYWAASQLDTVNRPLLGGMGPNNAMGSVQRAAQNAMGQLSVWNAIGDANVPTNLGAGSNESRIFLAAWDELFLFEGTPRTRVLTEVLSGTLQVRVQLYNYVATLPQRRPAAISVISGTGLISPAGF